MDDYDDEGGMTLKNRKKLTPEEQQTNYVLAISDIVQEAIKLHDQGKYVNIDGIKSRAAGRYGISKMPKLQELLAATPEKHKDKMKDIFLAKPIRSASGVAVVAVMSKPHRCPHIAMTGNICVYCFTADHQFLSRHRGWTDVKDIELGEEIATYNRVSDYLEYQPTKFIIHQDVVDKEMIEVGQETSGFSWANNSDDYGYNSNIVDTIGQNGNNNNTGVVTTADHDWFVKKGVQNTDGSISWSIDPNGDGEKSYEKVKGFDLINNNDGQMFKVKTRSGMGKKIHLYKPNDDNHDELYRLPFVKTLGLQTEEEKIAFLEIYGYWLNNGSLQIAENNIVTIVQFETSTQITADFITQRLNVLNIPFDQNIDKSSLHISEPRFVAYFNTEQRDGNVFAPWVYDRCDRDELRFIIDGLRLANGDYTDNSITQIIYTNDIKFRDEIIRICLYAGFWSFFSTTKNQNESKIQDNHHSWMITYGELCGSEAVFDSKRDVKPFTFTGKVYCAEVENGLLFARRVHKNTYGQITKATKPMIIMNCPGGVDSDFEYSTQSYTGYEPTSMRAIRARYDPYKQAKDRLEQLRRLGHSADKVEFILMGGTFLSLPEDYRDYFVRNLHDALSGHRSRTCAEAIQFSEQSNTRCVGLTIETRPDYCQRRHLHEMLGYGCTRLELGVQSTYEDVARDTNRGHTVKAVAEAFKMAKDCGFKVIAHMMPDLPNMGLERDYEQFVEYFDNPAFRSDGLKLYPTLVIRGTGLYELYKTGRFQNYPPNTLVDLLAKISALIPPWTRVYRIQRDIPMPLVTSGVEHGNLRQLVLKRMSDLGLACRDIRSREVGIKQINTGDSRENKKQLYTDQIELVRRDYTANGGWETFLSYEDPTNDTLIGLLRLRQCTADSFRPETVEYPTSFVRELHVYGSAVPVHNKDPTKFQHQGYGTLLMEQAERIARDEHGSLKLVVIAGVGTRNYYRKLGYELDGPYMSKWIA